MSIALKTLAVIIGVLGIGAGILAAVLMFVWGVREIVDGVNATPASGGLIGWGLVKCLFFAEAIGGPVTWLFWAIAGGIWVLGESAE